MCNLNKVGSNIDVPVKQNNDLDEDEFHVRGINLRESEETNRRAQELDDLKDVQPLLSSFD